MLHSIFDSVKLDIVPFLLSLYFLNSMYYILYVISIYYLLFIIRISRRCFVRFLTQLNLILYHFFCLSFFLTLCISIIYYIYYIYYILFIIYFIYIIYYLLYIIYYTNFKKMLCSIFDSIKFDFVPFLLSLFFLDPMY